MSNKGTSIYKLNKTGLNGFTEIKKAELDAKSIEVLNAQQQVEQFQAIANSLSSKLSNFQVFLAQADSNRSIALNNRTAMELLVQSTLDLYKNSEIAFTEITLADSKTKKLATQLNQVMDRLIFSAEVINKLSNLVIRKKAQNPLISDELVTNIGSAGNDANNAVALTLVALQTTFASQASNMESEAALALEYSQSLALFQLMTGENPLQSTAKSKHISKKGEDGELEETKIKKPVNLRDLFDTAYTDAQKNYLDIQGATDKTNKQLNNANILLNKAQVKLKSLQLGLAAGNAAALAS